MPELPEVEHLRRSLERDLLGARVERASLLRSDFVRKRPDRSEVRPAELLEGDIVEALERRGKQMAVVGRRGHGFVVQLGMSGQVRWRDGSGPPPDHVHVRWTVRTASGAERTLEFRDPRRFGGVAPFRSRHDLDSRLWSELGPDAWTQPADELAESISRAARDSRRAIKALILDQSVIAGVGNIYADESLFAAGIGPRLVSGRLDATMVRRLCLEIRQTLGQAVEAGGSTLRDYLDASGRTGSFQLLHRVYGRSGEACVRCGSGLQTGLVGGRTTVWCRTCQTASRKRWSPPDSPATTRPQGPGRIE